MELSDLLLTKEEVPILHESFFMVPIHPSLLDPDFIIDPSIAHEVFPDVANEWYEDLKRYVASVEDEAIRDQINSVFLNEKPRLIERYRQPYLDNINWRSDIISRENGFVRVFSISRDYGGSIYFNQDGSFGEKEFVPYGKGSEFIRFKDEEKIKSFGSKERAVTGLDGQFVYIYSQHNVDWHPGALFLRNWALAYMNEVFVRHPDRFLQ